MIKGIIIAALIVGIIGSVMFIGMLVYKLNHGKKAMRPGKEKGVNHCV